MDNFVDYLNTTDERLNEIINFISFVEMQKRYVREYRAISSKNLKKKMNKSCCVQDFYTLNQNLINSTVQYNAAIISLYGCFENFVDDIAREFLVCSTSGLGSFDVLPDSVKNIYIKNIGEFLSNPQRFSNMGLNTNDVINKLSRNISDYNETEIQHEFILRHKSNMKIDEISTLFNNVNIPSMKYKIKNNDHIIKYFSVQKDCSIDDVSALLANDTINAFSILDELVEERNNIAHTWKTSSRMSYSDMSERIIPYIKMLCLAITEILILEYYKILLEKKHMSIYDKPIAVYRNRILCINNKDSSLQIDDYILFKNKTNDYQIAKIISIEVNGSKYTKYDGVDTNIGIELDRNIKKEYTFFYIPTST